MKANRPRPNIFEYTDYRLYLRETYEHFKAVGPYSHRTFSEKAGLKSRSYLRLVLVGKRNLTPQSISKFISALELVGSEADAFTALVHFNQSTDLLARKHYWEVLTALKPRLGKCTRVHDIYAYLTRSYFPILLVLLRQTHVAHDFESLSRMTGLGHLELKEAIETFIKMGALLKNIDGTYTVSSPCFETGDDVMNFAIPTFHKNMMNLAASKTSLPQEEREFQSVFMPINDEEFRYVKSRLRALAEEFDERFGTGSRPQSQRIYILNMNLVPASPEFIRAENRDASQNSEGETKDLKEIAQ